MPLLIAAGVLVLVVVAAVLVLGVKRPPGLESVADLREPALPGGVAWTSWERRASCLHVARPDGTVTELRCDPEGGDLVGWAADDRLLLARRDAGGRMIEIHPTTGEVVATRPGRELDRPHPPGAEGVTSYTVDGVLVVELDDTELWRVAAPEGYDVLGSSVSPDERFVAMFDSAGRLLVVPADGTAPPRVWARSTQSWATPVWEGQLPG